MTATTGVTPAELRVLTLVAKGKPLKIVAYDLGIAMGTVKVHLRRLRQRFRVDTTLQLALGAVRANLVPLEDLPELDRWRETGTGPVDLCEVDKDRLK